MAAKTTALNIRIAPDDRYALELVARKRGMNLSQVIVKSLQKTFEEEGLTTEGPDGVCLLDKLWSESESERIERLAQSASSLMTREVKRLYQHIIAYRNAREAFATTQGGKDVSRDEIDEELASLRADGKA